MSRHELSNPTPRITLEASADELRRHCEAVARVQGGSTYYQEELGIFRDYAREKCLLLHAPPPELNRPPDEEGNAFLDPERKIVISDTHRGNIIRMEDGLLAPIDLRVEAISDSLFDAVIKLCQTSPPESATIRPPG